MAPRLTAAENETRMGAGAAAKATRRWRRRRWAELFALVAVAAPVGSGRPVTLETGAAGSGGMTKATGERGRERGHPRVSSHLMLSLVDPQ